MLIKEHKFSPCQLFQMVFSIKFIDKGTSYFVSETLNSIKPPQEEYYDEEDYDEYEIEELPLWKKIVNEIRVPLFIFLMILVFMSEMPNKTLIQKVPFLGNIYNEINTKGFLLKAVLCSLVAYVLIRFIRV